MVFPKYALKLKITIIGRETITITPAKTITSSNAIKNDANITKLSVNHPTTSIFVRRRLQDPYNIHIPYTHKL